MNRPDRFYEFDFKFPNEEISTIRAYGNVIRSAERSARRHLAREHGQEIAQKAVCTGSRYVKPEDR